MKVYDCFTYMNEDVVLDLRLNYLNKFVDKFVIVESLFFHNGKPKKLNFDIKKFSKFREKIIYLSLNNEPDDVESINKKDSIKTKNSKHILNGMRRDIYQRNYILNALKDSEDTDIIFISDIDEIPKLDNLTIKIQSSKGSSCKPAGLSYLALVDNSFNKLIKINQNGRIEIPNFEIKNLQ